MVTLDILVELKRLRDNPGFQHLVKVYDRNLNRLQTRLLHKDTEDSEVVRLKWGIHHLQSQHPAKVLEVEIKAVNAQMEKNQKEIEDANTK
jgi:hypothetical protein